MTERTSKLLLNIWLLVLLMFFIPLSVSSQKGRNAKVNNLYSCLKEFEIECPKTVLAVAIYETGWMECKKCSYQYNNLFGFRTNHEYVRFESIYECLDYLKAWQIAYYDPWKEKHPKGTYYEYMVHIRYARGTMSNYLRTIKAIERLVARNIEQIDSIPAPPEDEPEEQH